MNWILTWVKQIFAISILSGILTYMAPSQKYQRYLKFICAVLLTIVCVNPVLSFLDGRHSFDEVYAMVQSLGQTQELKNRMKFEQDSQKVLLKQLEDAVVTQIETQVLRCGLHPEQTDVVIDWDEESATYGEIQKITVKVSDKAGEKTAELMKVLKQELSQYYEIHLGNVTIYSRR